MIEVILLSLSQITKEKPQINVFSRSLSVIESSLDTVRRLLTAHPGAKTTTTIASTINHDPASFVSCFLSLLLQRPIHRPASLLQLSFLTFGLFSGALLKIFAVSAPQHCIMFLISGCSSALQRVRAFNPPHFEPSFRISADAAARQG